MVDVEKLRQRVGGICGDLPYANDIREALTELEQLRAVLAALVDSLPGCASDGEYFEPEGFEEARSAALRLLGRET